MDIASGLAGAELAALVRVSRAAMATFHDGYVAQHKPAGGLQFKLLAQRAHDPTADRDVYELLFSRAAQSGWLVDYVSAAIQAGIFAAPAGTEMGRQAKLVLQSYTRTEDGLGEPELLEPGVLAARARVCRVELDVPSGAETSLVTGTGFLVGPQAVLTNWHVVQDLFDRASGRPIEPAPCDVVIRFDEFTSTAGRQSRSSAFKLAEQWHIASGRAFQLGGQDEGWTEAATEDDIARLQDNPDFVALRLEGAPGFDRGWYDPAIVGKPRSNTSCFLFHHPGQFAQRYNSGVITALVGTAPARCKHDANSIFGSSGGLLLDKDMRLLALHQGGIEYGRAIDPETTRKIATENVAIPIKLIGEKLAGVAIADEKFRVLTQVGGSGHPVFGRDRLFQLMLETYRNERPILVVRTQRRDPLSGRAPPPMGRSFTLDIIKGRLKQTDNRFVKFSAARVPSDAHALATAILDAFDPAILAATPLPGLDAGATTTSGYIKDHLLKSFGEAVERHASGNCVWLCIDDLEKYELPSGSAREFLDTLYAGIRGLPSLRIVLLGLRGDLPSIAESDCNVDTLEEAPGEHDVAAWVRRRLGPGRIQSDDIAALFGKMIMAGGEAAGSGAAGGGIAALAAFVQSRINPCFPDAAR